MAIVRPLEGKDILSGGQFSKIEIEAVIRWAERMSFVMGKPETMQIAADKVLATLFDESSTRTRLSFQTAMHRLGGRVIGFSSLEESSMSKGETWADTIRTVDQYVDLIVTRNKSIGSAVEAANVANAPVLNGGDGAGEHPTQALLDLFTIRSELGFISGTTIALVGDLLNGRTVHSSVEVYKHFDIKLILVSQEELKMPRSVVEDLRAQKVVVEETTDLEMALAQSDVVYMTRIQRERFEDEADYLRLKDCYVLDRAMIERTNSKIVVMHPLPRINELCPDVDDMPNAAYFRQVKNGVYVRMALIAMVLGRTWI